MLELFSSGLMSAWLDMAGIHQSRLDNSQGLLWLGTPGFVLPTASEPTATATLQQYLKQWSKQGPGAGQGVWMQSGPMLLTSNQGTKPLPAASLTKIATSLAALSTWEPSHQFETLISTAGRVKNGVLWGDLVITGGGDPLFVWEEAIAVGNALNRLGIKRVSGNLIIKGNFAMNSEPNQAVSAEMLKIAFDSAHWPRSVAVRHGRMLPRTPKPQIAIAGVVKVELSPSSQQERRVVKAIPRRAIGKEDRKQILLLRHRSLTLAEILKQMNVYSSNSMAEMLADLIGGASVVSQKAAAAAGVPRREILLINGSGLGVENRISPRATCAMLVTIQRKLQSYGLTIGDLFPVAGRDRQGTMIARHMPEGTAIKTGTLRDVSALAGVMPTRDRGLVWFTIINRGNDVLGFRAEQDRFLQSFQQQWGATSQTAKAIEPNSSKIGKLSRLGADGRNEILPGG